MMETSLKTDIPESMRYNPHDIESKAITLGTIGNTSWNLLPKWRNGKLEFLEVSRTDNQFHFKIDATLFVLPQVYSPTKRNFTMYIEDGQTTIRLETKWNRSFTRGEEIIGNITINMLFIVDKPQLSDDLLCLLNNPDSYPDATIMSGATKILVHRCILAARSPVFAAMFRNQMKESLSGVVEVKVLEENVLQSILRYIYSGKTDNINSEFAGKLLFAADMYQLKELKAICVDKLKSSMKRVNLFRILLLGHLHDQELKDYAIGYICGFSKHGFCEIETAENWKFLKTTYPDLVIEVLTSVVKYNL